MKRKNEALVDVAVLLIFFSRPEQFSQVFQQVKKARPRALFLYQDGARVDREDDIKGIAECRAIAEDIDWDCKVYKFYQKENVGCDPSEFIAQKWAFSYVDKCIVLEDDDVPSVTFFQFCKELLDLYENDTRISMISGFNHEEVTQDVPYDYFFTSNCSIWGWASWRRVIDQWDEKYAFLEDDFNVRQLKSAIRHRKFLKSFIDTCKKHKSKNKAYYETILIANQWLHSELAIVPSRNMINNIGATNNSTHFSGNINSQPKGLRRIFTMKRYEVSFPIKHPKYVIENHDYKDRVYRIMAWGYPFVKAYRFAEQTFYLMFNNGIKDAIKNILIKLKNVCN